MTGSLREAAGAALAALLALVATVPTATQARAESLNIAIVSRTVFYVPLWAAERQGYLKDEGLEANIQVYDNAEKINADLRSGQVQVAISTPESVILDAYKGGNLRIIAGNAEKLPHFIIAKPSIKSLSALRGAHFGVLSLHEGTTFLVREVARAAGLTPSDYTIEAVGGAPTRWKLLRDGKIDAGFQPFPLSYEAEAAGFNNLGAVANYVPNYLFTAVNVDRTWADQHRPTVVAFLRALKKGQDFIATHPDEAAAIAAEELKTSAALAKRALGDTERLKILSPDLSVSNAALQTTFKTVQAVGLLDANVEFDFHKVVDESFLIGSTDMQLRDLGSFFVGGNQTQVSGLPTKEIKYAADAAPIKVNPNGTYANGQVYVQFALLSHPTRETPVLFLNGGTSTAAMWETTPDGRPGWQRVFLYKGFNTYTTDAVGKGRAGYAPFPSVFKAEPTFRANEDTWKLLRMGTSYSVNPGERAAFPNSQFPLAAFDQFAKQGVPRFAGQDDIELASYRELIRNICPCIIVAQSSGAYFAIQLANEMPNLVRAIVAVELTATPDLQKVDLQHLATTPEFILWGDNWQNNAFWQGIRRSVDAYAKALNDRGGKTEVFDLPSHGIPGNTHMMMMDLNNIELADLAVDWLDHLPPSKGPN